ncbi:MAG: hypothetical protein OJF51_004175 [Nitrospira sp.]|jgi:hypothetical protein|nr:MAG: hypothetical protein OJF51_004175 [Nitrospira sp.]
MHLNGFSSDVADEAHAEGGVVTRVYKGHENRNCIFCHYKAPFLRDTPKTSILFIYK